MKCLCKDNNGIDRLMEYLGGPGTAGRRAELELHAQECAECRGLLRAWSALDEFRAPEVSANFDQKLYARIARENEAPWPVRMWRTLRPAGPVAWWKMAIPAAACAVLVAVLAVRVPYGAADGDKSAKVEPVNIEQVEQALDDMDLLSPVSPAGAL